MKEECNYFDGASSCAEDSFGPFDVFQSDGTRLTTNAYACTTTHDVSSDMYDEFGLHLMDGLDNKPNCNCCGTNSELGFQDMGRIFTSFQMSTGVYWNKAIFSYWDENGDYEQPGALLIR